MKRSDFGIYRTDYSNYISDIRNRILQKCVKNDNGCLEYRAGKLKHKYGLTSITLKGKCKLVPVHRAIWMAINNQLELPRSVVVRHKCDNPSCCNIEHLEHGSAKDNMRDMYERGRQRKKETYKLHTRQRRLTNEQILDIRNGKDKPSYYCWKYNVSNSYISKIRNMKAKTLVQ